MSEPTRVAKAGATLAVALPLGALLWLAFREIDAWAAVEFARAELASMLVAVIDLGLFAAALCLVPALSALLLRRAGR